jgi:hypothetical protein
MWFIRLSLQDFFRRDLRHVHAVADADAGGHFN